MVFLKRWRIASLGRLFGSGPTAKNILTLLSGTAGAQVLSLVLIIPLARLYGPGPFGLYAIFQSFVLVGTTVAALRYDFAIVLPASNTAARVLVRLGSRLILVVSLFLTLVFLLLHTWVVSQYGSTDLAWWSLAVGLVVFLVSQTVNIQFWLTRTKQFGVMATNRALQSAGVALCQLAAFLVLPGLSGLVVGAVTGQLLTLAVLWSRTPALRQPLPPSAPTMTAMARRYRKFPLLNGPNALLDSVRQAGINLMIGNIAVDSLGQFSMAWRFTYAPASLVSGAVSQVFLQRMAVAQPGQLLPLVSAVLWRIALITVPVFGLAYWVAPDAFVLLLGSEWREAGEISRALIPWVFMNTFTSPLSNVFIVTERQQWLLLFAVIYTTAPLTLLVFSPLPLVPTIGLLGWLMATLLVLMIAMTVGVTRQYDRRDGGTAARVGDI